MKILSIIAPMLIEYLEKKETLKGLKDKNYQEVYMVVVSSKSVKDTIIDIQSLGGEEYVSTIKEKIKKLKKMEKINKKKEK